MHLKQILNACVLVYYVFLSDQWVSPHVIIYKLDAETKVTKWFRNPRARGCSVPSEARALLRARGFLNRLVTVGRGV